MKKLFVLLIAALTFSVQSCKVCECIPTVEVRDSIQIQHILDSVYLYEKDSIYIKDKGDTVFVDKWHTRYKDKIIEKVDTIKTEVYLENTKEVKYIPNFYKVSTIILWSALALLIVYIVLRILVRIYLKK